MAERRDGQFSPLPERRLFTRLKIELGELKGTLARPAAGTLSPEAAATPAAPRESFARRLADAAADFARDLRERPKETLAALVLPGPDSPFRRKENARVLAASFLGHLVVLAVLLYSGALRPLFGVRETPPPRDYEVTMLKLPPAPWLAPPPDQFPADMNSPDAFGMMPSVVPAAPAPPVVMQRPSRIRPAPDPRPDGGTLDTTVTEGAGAGVTPPTGGTEAAATPSPSPRVTPQSSPRRTSPNANAATAANTSATPRAGATPGASVPADEATAEFQRRLRDAVVRAYARHLAAAGQPT
ncbi:MAG TPA: hypothetical protein VER08_00345, partial [Pyrinomonadaceae bacterium]|nr:hypothetical protein [Pyrinomonadaceae bacterium]